MMKYPRRGGAPYIRGYHKITPCSVRAPPLKYMGNDYMATTQLLPDTVTETGKRTLPSLTCKSATTFSTCGLLVVL